MDRSPVGIRCAEGHAWQLLRRVALLLALASTGAMAQTDPTLTAPAPGMPPQWSRLELQVAIAGCRKSIVDNALRDYAKRQGIPESQLLPDVRARITPAMEPFLVSCDCMVNALSLEATPSEFALPSARLQQRMGQLLGPGGACARKQGA